MAMALHQARARSDHEVAAAGDQQRFDHSVTEAICRRPLRERSSDRWAASPRPHDKHHPLSAYMDMTWAMGRWSIGLGRSRIGSTRDEPPADTGRSSIIPATPRNRTDRTPASPSKSAGMDADGGPRGVAVAGAAVLPLYVDALRRDDSSAGEEVAGQGSSSAIELRLLLLTDDPGPRAQPSPPPLSPLAPSPLTSATGAAAVTSATGGGGVDDATAAATTAATGRNTTAGVTVDVTVDKEPLEPHGPVDRVKRGGRCVFFSHHRRSLPRWGRIRGQHKVVARCTAVVTHRLAAPVALGVGPP